MNGVLLYMHFQSNANRFSNHDIVSLILKVKLHLICWKFFVVLKNITKKALESDRMKFE